MKSEFLTVITRYLTTKAQAELLEMVPLRQEVQGFDARPRDAARDILNEFLADPIPFLEQAFGQPAGP